MLCTQYWGKKKILVIGIVRMTNNGKALEYYISLTPPEHLYFHMQGHLSPCRKQKGNMNPN